METYPARRDKIINPFSFPNEDSSLRLRDVIVRRGGVLILRGITLAFELELRHVLIGATGSGKSTLIRLLNRLDDPDSGTITLGDVPLASLPVLEVRRRIALVFQTPRPLPGTLGDNLLYPYSVGKSPAPDHEQQAEALRAVGLDPGWVDRDSARLSGGERQRLAIAVALGMKPEILVLDEPTAALDPASARVIASLLAHRAATDKLRTIVVTHDRAMAPLLGDWGIRLEAGMIRDQGPIQQLLDRADGVTRNP